MKPLYDGVPVLRPEVLEMLFDGTNSYRDRNGEHHLEFNELVEHGLIDDQLGDRYYFINWIYTSKGIRYVHEALKMILLNHVTQESRHAHVVVIRTITELLTLIDKDNYEGVIEAYVKHDSIIEVPGWHTRTYEYSKKDELHIRGPITYMIDPTIIWICKNISYLEHITDIDDLVFQPSYFYTIKQISRTYGKSRPLKAFLSKSYNIHIEKDRYNNRDACYRYAIDKTAAKAYYDMITYIKEGARIGGP